MFLGELLASSGWVSRINIIGIFSLYFIKNWFLFTGSKINIQKWLVWSFLTFFQSIHLIIDPQTKLSKRVFLPFINCKIQAYPSITEDAWVFYPCFLCIGLLKLLGHAVLSEWLYFLKDRWLTVLYYFQVYNIVIKHLVDYMPSKVIIKYWVYFLSCTLHPMTHFLVGILYFQIPFTYFDAPPPHW